MCIAMMSLAAKQAKFSGVLAMVAVLGRDNRHHNSNSEGGGYATVIVVGFVEANPD